VVPLPVLNGRRSDVFVIDDDDDRPVDGKQVIVNIDEIWKGGTLRCRTDDTGHAIFETAADYESSRGFNIKVDRQRFGPYRVGDIRFTVRLS